jgi:hypothetical protein
MKARDLLACCFLAAAPFAYAAPVHAADPEVEARERFDRAVKLYEEGNYDAALVEFQRAAALRPSYKLFYNMGQVRVALQDYAAALEAYRLYLEQGGDKVPAARREQVQQEMKRLEPRVARLSVETDVPGAEVLVDDRAMGKTPLAAPLIVNAGSRRIQVRHPSHAPQSRVVSLAGAVQDRVLFRFATDRGSAQPARPDIAPSPAAETPMPRHERVQRSASGLWIGWAVTGALAAGAAVTGVMALTRDEDLEQHLEERVERKSELESDAKTVRTLAVVSDGLAVAALAAGGATLWLTLASGNREGRATPAGAGRRDARRLRVGVGPSGAVLRGSF